VEWADYWASWGAKDHAKLEPVGCNIFFTLNGERDLYGLRRETRMQMTCNTILITGVGSGIGRRPSPDFPGFASETWDTQSSTESSSQRSSTKLNLPMISPAIAIAAVFTLIPFLAVAFFSTWFAGATETLSASTRLLAPSLICIPYLLVAFSAGIFHWVWLALYALLPVAVSALLWQARHADTEQRGNWRDFLVLAALGLAVDLRWFEHAWPAHLTVFNKILLLDAGIWGFLAVRRLDGAGFDLRLRLRDLGIGLRELAFYTPIAISLGLGIGFLHLHPSAPWLSRLPTAFLFTFFFIAVPEELFFRGWLQNLLERRIGRDHALFWTAVLFGLAHFNKRAVHFNWRYVLLAALAGIFYGRAWRQQRRVGASAITHACVDTIWSLWLR
jgi:membrane protease YdiL (CAAX protease family)